MQYMEKVKKDPEWRVYWPNSPLWSGVDIMRIHTLRVKMHNADKSVIRTQTLIAQHERAMRAFTQVFHTLIPLVLEGYLLRTSEFMEYRD